MSMARSTRSGTLVGPGICRKCLPVCKVIWRPSRSCLGLAGLEYHYSAGLSPARPAPSMHKKADLAADLALEGRFGLAKLKTRQVFTTFRCAGEFDCVGSSSDFIAASTPPARCGTPATERPISTPDKAPIKVSSLHSPRWPMRNTLPASLLRPEPSDML